MDTTGNEPAVATAPSRRLGTGWDPTILPWIDGQEVVLIAGDWHGTTAWARRVAAAAADRGVRTIIQLGDLAVLWPGPDRFTLQLETALADADVRLVFIDGNHDSHNRLREIPLGPDGFARIDQHIWWAPRGHRWSWAGRAFGALGGAFSVDWRRRIEGLSFWAGIEEVDPRDIVRLGSQPLDVLLSHDAPLGGPLKGDFRLAPEDEHRSRRSRELVAQAVENTRPTLAFHGHWHQRRTYDLVHADAPRSAVTTWTTRPPWLSVATSRTANPGRSNSRDTADLTLSGTT